MFALVIMANEALAFNEMGHQSIVTLANKYLTESAKNEVKAILGGEMITEAVWLNTLRKNEATAYTKAWHFFRLDEQGKSTTVDANDGVVVLENAIAVLRNRANKNAAEVKDALRTVIHLVGDMHCPMHAGHKSDKGGNGTKVKYFGKQKKLHSVWDSEIVESAHRWSYSEWQQNIDRANKKQQKMLTQGTPNDWIEETVLLAHDIYERSTIGGNLSYDYVAYYAPVIEQQLLKGGLRLAKLLEEIY